MQINLKEVHKYTHFKKRLFLVLLAGFLLLMVYLFHAVNYFELLTGQRSEEAFISKEGIYIFNKVLRFLLNDLLALLMIYAIFYERKYFVFAVYVQLFGMIFILFPYLFLKLHYPAYNGPLLSHLHRLILNPVLLMLLIPALMYQKNLEKKAP